MDTRRLTWEEVKALRRKQRTEKAMTASLRVRRAKAEEKKKIKAATRSRRIEKLSDKLTERYLEQTDKSIKYNRQCFMRTKPADKPKYHRMVAYDLETTKIKAGTPRLKYLTAYNGKPGEDFWFSGEVKTQKQLAEILESRFLTKENDGTRFVAWNGNGYDVYFIAAALIFNSEYIIKPYLTKTKSLRGIRVYRQNLKESWEFLDGCAMLGIKRKLSEFLKTFASDYLKLDSPDWETEEFNAKNKKHVEYAERDSVGLWHAMEKARDLFREIFHVDLAPTIGNTAIKIFGHHIPKGVKIRETNKTVADIIHRYAMRGGYCELSAPYVGPLWKYDINQAYAAAMRDGDLPEGSCYHLDKYSSIPKCALWRITATHESNIIPFYYKPVDSERDIAAFATREIRDTWITSSEYRQLESEGWKITTIEGYWWESAFRMTEYVDKLEDLRVNAPGGPKSAQGELIKAVGNNSYGKTVSKLQGLDMVMAGFKPVGYHEYQDPNERFQHLWFQLTPPQKRAYHQPQIGAFITAHVRMVVRRAALLNAADWVYADTDCVAFKSGVALPISSSRYGDWKIEAEGKMYSVLAKKVYWANDGSDIKAKGISTKQLTELDKANWLQGIPPEQKMLMKANFLEAMTGAEMFIERTRKGTAIVKIRQTATQDDGE